MTSTAEHFDNFKVAGRDIVNKTLELGTFTVRERFQLRHDRRFWFAVVCEVLFR